MPDPQVVAEAWDAWRAEVDFATRFVAEAPSLDITGHDPENRPGSGGGPMSLREVRVDEAWNAIAGAEPRDAIERVVGMRDEARRTKDWPASDRLRDALLRCGIEVKDSKEGTTWRVAG